MSCMLCPNAISVLPTYSLTVGVLFTSSLSRILLYSCEGMHAVEYRICSLGIFFCSQRLLRRYWADGVSGFVSMFIQCTHMSIRSVLTPCAQYASMTSCIHTWLTPCIVRVANGTRARCTPGILGTKVSHTNMFPSLYTGGQLNARGLPG
jgi:hypothetical protein